MALGVNVLLDGPVPSLGRPLGAMSRPLGARGQVPRMGGLFLE